MKFLLYACFFSCTYGLTVSTLDTAASNAQKDTSKNNEKIIEEITDSNDLSKKQDSTIEESDPFTDTHSLDTTTSFTFDKEKKGEKLLNKIYDKFTGTSKSNTSNTITPSSYKTSYKTDNTEVSLEKMAHELYLSNCYVEWKLKIQEKQIKMQAISGIVSALISVTMNIFLIQAINLKTHKTDPVIYDKANPDAFNALYGYEEQIALIKDAINRCDNIQTNDKISHISDEYTRTLLSSSSEEVKPWLFEGDPGNGKTELANTIAKYRGGAFFNIGSSDIITKWVGDSEKNVHKLFQHAKELSKLYKVTILIDECDSLAAKRTSDDRTYKNATTETLFRELDLISKDPLLRKRILIIFSTNLSNTLDAAFVRRVRPFHILNPNASDRAEIFANVLMNKKAFNEEDFEYTEKQNKLIMKKYNDKWQRLISMTDDLSCQHIVELICNTNTKIQKEILELSSLDPSYCFTKAQFLDTLIKQAAPCKDTKLRLSISDEDKISSMERTDFQVNPKAFDHLYGYPELKKSCKDFIDQYKDIEQSKESSTDTNQSTLYTVSGTLAAYNDSEDKMQALLLYGPPGNGKTELAKAIAEYQGRTFFFVRTATLEDALYNNGAQKIEKLFGQIISLSKSKPCTVLFNECDSVLTRRDINIGGQKNNVTNTILRKIEEVFGYDIQIIFDTNMGYALDNAFERRTKPIKIDNPTESDRRAIVLGILTESTKNRPAIFSSADQISQEQLNTAVLSSEGLSCAYMRAALRELRTKVKSSHTKIDKTATIDFPWDLFNECLIEQSHRAGVFKSTHNA